jgi:helicase
MSEVLYEDCVGVASRAAGYCLGEIETRPELIRALSEVMGKEIALTPPQVAALAAGVLETDKHFLVVAPTNSGKTLIALLRIFHRALSRGGRFVYVAPLKAIAEEKLSEFGELAAAIARNGGREVSVAITTGDYQLTEDFPDSAPPESGEVLVCTPERLEVILRNPVNHGWARSIDTFVLDEFHLLGEGGRGARFEALVTELLLHCPNSCLCGLSATVGEPEVLTSWLGTRGKEAELIESSYRFPALTRRLVRTDDKEKFVIETARQVMKIDGRSLMVFVYRKADTEAMAERLKREISDSEAIAAFHSGMSVGERLSVGQRFRDRSLRVLVSTTSLKMGINSPATDVIIRDSVFPGVGRLSTGDVLQMLGRAGRGATPGVGTVLVGMNESAENYRGDFVSGVLQPIHPQLLNPKSGRGRKNTPVERGNTEPIRTVLLSQLCVKGELRPAEFTEFLQNTLSGRVYGVKVVDVQSAIQFLEQEKLVYRLENSEDTYAATRIGRTASFTGLSAETGAMLGGFLRALIRLEEKGRVNGTEDGGVLRHITSLDLLFLACVSFEVRDQVLGKPRARDIDEVIELVERLPPEEKPIVNRWRSSESDTFPTRRLLSSLRIEHEKQTKEVEEATFYRYLRTALMLWEHCAGRSLAALQTKYDIYPGAFESGLKPTVLWILNCIAQICTGKRCYKLDFLALQAFELIGDLSIGAKLGKLMALPGFGRRSAERLLESGIRDFNDERLKSMEHLLAAGLRKPQAELVRRAVARRER